MYSLENFVNKFATEDNGSKKCMLDITESKKYFQHHATFESLANSQQDFKAGLTGEKTQRYSSSTSYSNMKKGIRFFCEKRYSWCIDFFTNGAYRYRELEKFLSA
jgi:hypothetical protein